MLFISLWASWDFLVLSMFTPESTVSYSLGTDVFLHVFKGPFQVLGSQLAVGWSKTDLTGLEDLSLVVSPPVAVQPGLFLMQGAVPRSKQRCTRPLEV